MKISREVSPGSGKESSFSRKRIILWLVATLAFTAPRSLSQKNQSAPAPLELSRTVRPWEFLPVTGTRAALFGNENGTIEAWVYPLKIFREFHLNFLTAGRVLPAETLARTLSVHPESATILYAGDTFTVRETLFVPIDSQGAVILLNVETEQPLEIEAVFHRDYQLMWPAALGATYLDWSSQNHAFYFGEEQRKFSAFVGSPTAADPQSEFQTNYAEAQTNSFRLGAAKGKDSKLIVIAASMEGHDAALKTYQHLTADYAELQKEAAKYYQDYLARTVTLDLPDTQIQQAYDWARISEFQGLVTNPYLGTGLVAGYRTSGESQRPGFAWFFGRDSFWTSHALDASGDFSTARTALAFISKFQREDGKIPHEISQGANFVDWFQGYPYPYASADATPLYLIAMNDYVTASGDVAFAKEKWDSLWKAYEFLRSTYDEHGFAKNQGVGHGWVEGGPLLPVKAELYQTGLGIEALRSLAYLASRLPGKEDASKELAKTFAQQRALMNDTFWLPDKKRFAFALDNNNHPVDEPTVLSTVPMWFGLFDDAKADAMITQLADLDHQTDWGMRIISDHSPKFSGGGYHYGSVWPLFTGWAAVGEYRYHRAFPAYENLRANALLGFDGALGHFSEVLSGDFYQSLSTSSPHQIWSAAMVVSPLLRGLFGLTSDAATRTLTFSPHVPADWTSFAIRNVAVASARFDLHYAKDLEGITLEAKPSATFSGDSSLTLDFQPAISLRAKILGATLNGRPVLFHVEPNPVDQHVLVRVSLSGGANTLRIRLKDDFGLVYNSTLPALGSPSEGLRIISEAWSPTHDRLALAVSGLAGHEYRLSVWNPAQIATVSGARLTTGHDGRGELFVEFAPNPSEPVAHATISLQFVK